MVKHKSRTDTRDCSSGIESPRRRLFCVHYGAAASGFTVRERRRGGEGEIQDNSMIAMRQRWLFFRGFGAVTCL